MPLLGLRVSEAIAAVEERKVVPEQDVSGFQVQDKRRLVRNAFNQIEGFDLSLGQVWNVRTSGRRGGADQRPP